jgi:hypothetical protein
MNRIVAGITSLEQHKQTLSQTPNLYRPSACPHCGIKAVWPHGHYHRKADLCHRGEANLNPVPIPRYCCSACGRTCSRLPECIAPRRWYNWNLQQIGLIASLKPPEPIRLPREESLTLCPAPVRRTLQRWRHWLQERTPPFRQALISRFPELGRTVDEGAFWHRVFNTLGLSLAMAWLNPEMSVP